MRLKFANLLFFLCLLCTVLPAQDKERLRKALAALKDAPDDTNKVMNLDYVAWDTSYENLAAGLRYSEQALRLAEKLNYDRGIIHSCNTLGTIYSDMGDLNKSLNYHLRGLALADKLGSTRGMGTAELNISIVYSSMNEYAKALNYLRLAREHYKKTNHQSGLAVVYTDLGGCYLHFEDSIGQALESFRASFDIALGLKQQNTVANSLAGMARCYDMMGDSVGCDQTMKRAIALMDSTGNKYEYSMMLANYAHLLSGRKHYRRAEKLLFEALAIYRSIGMREQEVDLWEGLADIYEHTGELQKAIDAWKRFSSLKDSTINENVLRKQRELEAVYQSEKQESEIRSLKQEKQITELDLAKRTAEKDRLTGLVTMGGIAFVLLVLFALYILISLRQKKKANSELGRAYSVIEEKNKNITDSINYARKIQEALLPQEESLRKNFSDAFVLYRPRDIVSGDFWWFTEKEGKFLLAAADCTGHGVPGGFMSVMSAAFLSEIVNEKNITDPAAVLGELRLKVIAALRQKQDIELQQGEVKDGMDISFCCFSGKQLSMACANNPIWLVRGSEIQEYSADRFPVGIHHGELRSFTRQEVALQPGDMIYLFSDGFADQFGGPEGKKFKYRKLKELVLSISELPCQQQKQKAVRAFDQWRGGLEQVDDVLVIGLRV